MLKVTIADRQTDQKFAIIAPNANFGSIIVGNIADAASSFWHYLTDL